MTIGVIALTFGIVLLMWAFVTLTYSLMLRVTKEEMGKTAKVLKCENLLPTFFVGLALVIVGAFVVIVSSSRI